METTWILVADRTEARLFESKGPGKGTLQHLRDIPHPEGRLQPRDMEADEPGRISDSFGTRHALSPHHDPEDRHAHRRERITSTPDLSLYLPTAYSCPAPIVLELPGLELLPSTFSIANSDRLQWI